MDLFWEQGYEATSVRELVAHAGISTSSLYATFGDKRDVYIAALDRYRALEREGFAASLNASRSIRPILVDVMTDLIDALLAGGSRGSFTLNAAIELGGRDPGVTEQLRAHLDDIAGLLAARFVVAQQAGEISRDHPADDLAHYILMGIYSMAVMVKIYPDRKQLDKMADMLLSILDC